MKNQRHTRGNTSINEEKSEWYYWFTFLFLSIINLHTCISIVAPISTDQNWKHFWSNPLYILHLTWSDSPFFSLPKNTHLYIVLKVKSTQILIEC